MGASRRKSGGVLLFGIAFAAMLLIVAGGASAAAPTNDDFANATVVTGSSGSLSGQSNVDATFQGSAGEKAHDGDPGGHSIWYSLQAPDGGPFVIRASGLGGNAVLSVYTGTSLSTLDEDASNDSGTSTSPSVVCVSAPAATTFSIAIDGYGGATGSDITVSWDRFNGGSPCPTSTPSVNGNFLFPTVGSVLTAVDATWLGGVTSQSHQWYRCVGPKCGPIAGATGPQYVVTTDDVSARLRVADHASNGNGSFETASPPTPHVVAVQPENANGAKFAYAIPGGGLWTADVNLSSPSGVAQLTNGANDAQPNWVTHGDGSLPERIAFSRNGNLAIANLVRRPTAGALLPGPVVGGWPSVRRNGNRIAYSTGSQINIVDPDGTNITHAASFSGDLHPSYSPDGTRIVFEESGDIFIGLAGSNTSDTFVPLTSSGNNHEPSWAPDGSEIAFIHDGQLWTMDADGENAEAAPDDGAHGRRPDMVTDRGRDSLRGDAVRRPQRHLLDQVGRKPGPTDLTQTPAVDEVQPTWQPQAIAPTIGQGPSISGTAQTGQTLAGNDGFV